MANFLQVHTPTGPITITWTQMPGGCLVQAQSNNQSTTGIYDIDIPEGSEDKEKLKALLEKFWGDPKIQWPQLPPRHLNAFKEVLRVMKI